MTTGIDLPDFVTYKIYTSDKVNSVLSATLQHLDSEQIITLRDSLIERTPPLASEEKQKTIDIMNKVINRQVEIVRERNEEISRLKAENERLRGEGWISIDYDNVPKGEVLLFTVSKTILKGDWYENNLVKGFGWRTERSQWRFLPTDGLEYLSLTPKEEITHWQPLPPPPKSK